MNAPRRHRVDVNGWIVLDKPVGMTSTHAVVRRPPACFNAKKAGHAGTLDPLASGILPLAFGEATKTVPYVVDGEKAYTFTVRWGIETDTDDSEGARRRDQRPAAVGRGRDRGRAAALHRRDRAGAAALLGDQDRRRARLRSRPRRRDGRAEGPHRRHPRAAPRRARRRDRHLRGGMRQGHLCARHRPRPGPRAGLPRPRHRAAPHARRAVHARRRRHLRRRWKPRPRPAHEVLLPVEGGLTELPCVVAEPRRRRPPAARPVRHPARPRRAGRRRPRLRAPAAAWSSPSGMVENAASSCRTGCSTCRF